MNEKVQAAIAALNTASTNLREVGSELLANGGSVEHAQRAVQLVRAIDERVTEVEQFEKRLETKAE